MPTRICKKCRTEKPFEAFAKSKLCKDGISWTCRQCATANCTRWKQENRERLAKRRREIYALNEGAEVKAREQRRREREPLKVSCQRLRSGMFSRAQERGLPFDSEYFTVPKLMELLEANPQCECCQTPFAIGKKTDGRFRAASPTIDQFRPKEGYNRGNVAILCWKCNNLKRDATAEDLLRIATWMQSRVPRL